MLSMVNGELVVTAENVAVDFKNTSVLLFDALPALDVFINQGLDLIEPALLGIMETVLPVLIEAELSNALSGFTDALSLDETFELPALVPGQEPAVLRLQTQPSKVFPSAKSLRLVMDGLAYAENATRPYNVPGSPRFTTCGPVGGVPTPPPGPMLIGVQDDLINQLAFAVWDASTLSMTVDGEALEGLGLASYGVEIHELVLDGMLPPMLESCDGEMKLQIGDLFVDADLDLLGEWAHFGLWIQAEARVDFVTETDEEGVSKLTVDLQGFDPIHLEVVSNEGMFEGDDAGLVSLIADTMLPLLLENLAGSALALEIPSIDLGSISDQLPAGTTLDIDIQGFSRSGGYLVIDAGLK
jgi:hypothetical protein